jgi:hypothetical protein
VKDSAPLATSPGEFQKQFEERADAVLIALAKTVNVERELLEKVIDEVWEPDWIAKLKEEPKEYMARRQQEMRMRIREDRFAAGEGIRAPDDDDSDAQQEDIEEEEGAPP